MTRPVRVDLHSHTTASDGRSTPDALAAAAAAAGVDVLALTDHDTVAGCEPTARACAALGVRFLPGIEITAVADARDVHVLGYFFDAAHPPLAEFLAAQRRQRVDRVREMGARLRRHGADIDIDAVLAPAVEDTAKAVGRPWLARALVARGYVRTVPEAFDKWLSAGCPAFVPRIGASVSEVIARLHEAGGIASLAHPVFVKRDAWIPRLVDEGLDALEAYHSDHTPADTARYLAMAEAHGLLVTGGSDYHGDDQRGRGGLGSVTLPEAHFARLIAGRS